MGVKNVRGGRRLRVAKGCQGEGVIKWRHTLVYTRILYLASTRDYLRYGRLQTLNVRYPIVLRSFSFSFTAIRLETSFNTTMTSGTIFGSR